MMIPTTMANIAMRDTTYYIVAGLRECRKQKLLIEVHSTSDLSNTMHSSDPKSPSEPNRAKAVYSGYSNRNSNYVYSMLSRIPA